MRYYASFFIKIQAKQGFLGILAYRLLSGMHKSCKIILIFKKYKGDIMAKHKKVAVAKKRDFSKAIPWVAGIGLLATIELIVVYFMANFVPDATPSICSINSKIDCDAVARTNFALFLGVPNAIWGFLFYAFVMVLYFAKSLKEIKLFKFMEVFAHPKSYIFLMSLVMSIASVIFAYISTVEIGKICIFCFVTYLLNFILLFVSKPSKQFVDILITTIDDFMKAISNKIYAIAFFLVVAAGISTLIYLENSKVFFPPEKSVFSEEIKNFETTVTGNELGNPSAEVVINEFTDIQCPFCALSNTMMHKIVDEYDNVRVIHHDLPLDMDCNPIMTQQMHPNSCLYSQYGMAAEKQGKKWGLISAMFANNKELSEEKVLELAQTLELNTDKLKKDAHSKEIQEKLKEEIQTTLDMKINATPTYIINGKRYEGIFKYPDLEKIVIELGAVKKQK